LLLDCLVREIGPTIYNEAIADTQAYLRDRVADLEGACSQSGFAYWPKTGPVSVRRKRPYGCGDRIAKLDDYSESVSDSLSFLAALS